MDMSGSRKGCGGWVRVAAARRRAGGTWLPVYHSTMSTAAARLSRRVKEVGQVAAAGCSVVVGVVTRPATVWLVVGDQGKFRKEHKDACVGCGYQRPGTRSGLLLSRPCFVAGMENGRV